MFKKENITTTIVVFIILAIIGLGVYGSMNKNSNNEVAPTFQTTTEKNFLMEEQPIIGKEGAKAELQLYFDYLCNHCANWELTMLDQVQDIIKENEEVSLRFINYQFLGQTSLYAGMGGEIVHEYAPEKYVDYSKEIFKKQINVNKDYVVKTVAKYVKDLKEEEIEAKIDAQEYMDHLIADKTYGELMGVKSTPTLMINGELIQNAYDINEINVAIQLALAQKEIEEKNTEETKEEKNEEEVKEETKEEVKEEKGE